MTPNAVNDELKFWKTFVKTDRFLEGWVPDTPTPELRPQVRKFLQEHLTPESSVLDCGSGVVSILRGTVPAEQLEAADPLADHYAEIFDYKAHNIDRPYRLSCEDLTDATDEEYDIVHISNALDHTQDPLLAVAGMFKVLKPGGYLIIQSFENEATAQKWQGMHQWNVFLEGEKIYAQGRNGKFSINPDREHKVISIEKIPHAYNGKTWFIYIIQKP